MCVPPDANEGVCESTRAALLLRQRCNVVPKHSLHIELQHEAQQAALLTLLVKNTSNKQTFIKGTKNVNPYSDYFVKTFCVGYLYQIRLTAAFSISELSRSFTSMAVSPDICEEHEAA